MRRATYKIVYRLGKKKKTIYEGSLEECITKYKRDIQGGQFWHHFYITRLVKGV